MREEDSTENKFMLTIKQILMSNFELTKKYMIEKNAKLEMVHKMKQRMGIAKAAQQQAREEESAKGKLGKKQVQVKTSEVELVPVAEETLAMDSQEEDEPDDNLMGINLDEDDTIETDEK